MGLGSVYQTVKSWCYDNCGGCGSRDWYMKPRFDYYVERTKMRPSYQAKFPAYPGYVEKFDGGYYETERKCLAEDYRKCTLYDFNEVDISNYLMPTEVEEYKQKCEIDPMIGAEPLKKPHPWNFNRVKPSEFKGTEEEQYKKERLRWQIHPRNNSTSVYDFWRNGFYGLIGIECDKPWKSKFLAEVFRRMGQHTGQFEFDHSESKIYTPSEYIGGKPEKIVPFNELNMTDYLTVEEMEKLVDKLVTKPKERLSSRRTRECGFDFVDFICTRSPRYAIKCGNWLSRKIMGEILEDRGDHLDKEDIRKGYCRYDSDLCVCSDKRCRSEKMCKEDGFKIANFYDLDFGKALTSAQREEIVELFYGREFLKQEDSECPIECEVEKERERRNNPYYERD
ncbi:MAG: hypothetical protein IJW59_05370 [Clostridia bacterium]|nr:hypothetical protein [Clostridia bacterium]